MPGSSGWGYRDRVDGGSDSHFRDGGGGGFSDDDPPLMQIRELAADGRVKLRGLVLSRTPINKFKKDPTRGVFNFLLADSAKDSISVAVFGSVDALEQIDMPYSRAEVEITAMIKAKDTNSWACESTSSFGATVDAGRDAPPDVSLPINPLSPTDPMFGSFDSLYRQPILNLDRALVNLNEVIAMTDRLKALPPKEHVKVSFLALLAQDVETKTTKAGRSFAKLTLVDNSGPKRLSSVTMMVWNEHLVEALKNSFTSFTSVILVLNGEATWSTFENRVIVTAKGQAMVVQDPDLKQGLALYNARESLRTEFARTWVPEQSVTTDDRDWSAVVDQYHLSDVVDVVGKGEESREIAGRVEGAFLSVQNLSEYVARQPTLSTDGSYSKPLECEIIDQHARARAVVSVRAVECVLGAAADLAIMSESELQRLWSRLIAARHEFVFKYDSHRKGSIMIMAIA